MSNEKFVAFSKRWQGILLYILPVLLPAFGLHFGDDAKLLFTQATDNLIQTVGLAWAAHGFADAIEIGRAHV